MHNLLQNQFISLFVVIAIIAFIIYRQIRPRKLSTRGLIVIPILMLFFIIQSLPTFHPSQTKILEIIIVSIVSIILGLLACRQLHVSAGPSGKAIAKGSWTYFLWWLAALLLNLFYQYCLVRQRLKT